MKRTFSQLYNDRVNNENRVTKKLKEGSSFSPSTQQYFESIEETVHSMDFFSSNYVSHEDPKDIWNHFSTDTQRDTQIELLQAHSNTNDAFNKCLLGFCILYSQGTIEQSMVTLGEQCIKELLLLTENSEVKSNLLTLLYYICGVWKYNLGFCKEAIFDFNKALELRPHYSALFSNRGNAFAELEMFDEALNDLNIAISLDSQHATHYYNRSFVYEGKEQYLQSLIDARRACELDPKDENFMERYQNAIHHIMDSSRSFI
jgi:tetratricopeptide (TPR) repeat protein